MLYTWNSYNVLCQLRLNKKENKNKQNSENFSSMVREVGVGAGTDISFWPASCLCM